MSRCTKRSNRERFSSAETTNLARTEFKPFTEKSLFLFNGYVILTMFSAFSGLHCITFAGKL